MFEKNERRFDLKTKLFKEATYKRYVLGKLSKFDQISTQISSDCCLQRILRKLKQTRKTSSSGQQHVNGHLHIKKMFFPVLRFSTYFLTFSSTCPLYMATIKTILYCFGEVCKSYCLIENDWQKIG